MSTPAGWYPDPQNPAAQRYWDGTAWTQQTTAPGAPPAPAVQTLKVGFGQAVRRGFSRWTNYRDRATLAEYWWFYLFAFLVTLVMYAVVMAALVYFIATADKTPVTRQRGSTTVTTTDLDPTSAGITALVIAGVLMLVVLILLFFPQLALTVRRLHDSDKSGWWYLLSLVPFGGLVVLVFTLLPGTPGPNRYGPPVTS